MEAREQEQTGCAGWTAVSPRQAAKQTRLILCRQVTGKFITDGQIRRINRERQIGMTAVLWKLIICLIVMQILMLLEHVIFFRRRLSTGNLL